jgi:hypothetical protein
MRRRRGPQRDPAGTEGDGSDRVGSAGVARDANGSNLMEEEYWAEKGSFYVAVGQAISVWASMETKLVYIFSLLLGIAPERAGLIMYSIINFMTWLNLITDLFASEPVFKQFSGGWNKKLERLKALNDTRTRLAHHTSLRQTDGPIGLRPSQLDTRSKSLAYHPLTVDEVHDFSAKVVAIHKEITELFEAMALSLPPSDDPPEEPAPDPAA